MALLHNKVEEFKERIKEKAEKLLSEVFPKKIIELDRLLNSPDFSLPDLNIIHEQDNIPVPDPIYESTMASTDQASSPLLGKKRKHENFADRDVNIFMNGTADASKIDLDTIQGIKVNYFPNGMFPSNSKICHLYNLLKPFQSDFMDDVNLVKMWILFLIPRIEDGNNFGVAIQEEALAEVRQVESDSTVYLEHLSRYHVARGKLISKVAKYPHIEDYRMAIKQLDERQYLALKLTCAEIRNNYSSLHDLILKNIDKIKKPKTNNMDNLY